MYKLYNYIIDLEPLSNNIYIKSSNPIVRIKEASTRSTDGTLVCDEDYLKSVFYDNGDIKVICGKLYDKPYGVIITDFVADAIIRYGYAKSYEDILGLKRYSTVTNYINAIIDTNYKVKYEKEVEELALIHEEFDYYKALNANDNYHDYIYDVLVKYNISYSLNENFKSDLINSKIFSASYIKLMRYDCLLNYI